MKSHPLIVLFALAAAVAAFAGDAVVISSFAVPGLSVNGPRGLGFDGVSTFAVADDRNLNQVRVLKFTYNGTAASVVSSFNCPTNIRWALDLAWAPGYVYVADDLANATSRGRIFKLDAGTGSCLASFVGPYGSGVHVNGLAWFDGALFTSSYESAWVYRLNAAGVPLASFAAPHASNTGLAAAGGWLWAVSTRPEYEFLQYSGGGVLAGRLNFNVNNNYVGGACAGRPALGTVFVSTYTGSQLIYEYAASGQGGEGIGIAPSSFGRIKTLFR